MAVVTRHHHSSVHRHSVRVQRPHLSIVACRLNRTDRPDVCQSLMYRRFLTVAPSPTVNALRCGAADADCHNFIQRRLVARCGLRWRHGYWGREVPARRHHDGRTARPRRTSAILCRLDGRRCWRILSTLATLKSAEVLVLTITVRRRRFGAFYAPQTSEEWCAAATVSGLTRANVQRLDAKFCGHPKFCRLVLIRDTWRIRNAILYRCTLCNACTG